MMPLIPGKPNPGLRKLLGMLKHDFYMSSNVLLNMFPAPIGNSIFTNKKFFS